MASRPKILILGGTEDARKTAEELAVCDYKVLYSLAGVTHAPALPQHANISIQTGGFGGLAGLENFITTNQCDCLVDATHPFATQMSQTCSQVKFIPVVRLTRSMWQPQQGDSWHHVSNLDDAVTYLGTSKVRDGIFLSLGAKYIREFYGLTHLSFVARMIEIPEQVPDHINLIKQRGPFSLHDETKLFQKHQIKLLVTRNSGATASYAKIEAARQLGIPVLMIDPPPLEFSKNVTQIKASQLIAHLSQMFS